MTNRLDALKQLLTGDLPLENVGPHLRHSVRRAVRSGVEDRMAHVARVVVAELLRRGDLLRIAVEESRAETRPLYLLKGTTRLLDLGVLGAGGELVAPIPDLKSAGPSELGLQKADSLGVADFAGLLGVMEQAQELEIGNPNSENRGVVLTGILRLLARLTPQFHLFLMVDDARVVPEDQDYLFTLKKHDPAFAWLSARQEGQSFWIPEARELPAHLQHCEEAARNEPGAWNGRGYAGTVAVPLDSADAALEETEAGLLFVAAREQWDKDSLLKLARRLSRFVARRWQRQSEVNQRIHKDALTRVFNRGYFDDQFPLEVERARRSRTALTLVMADIDRFKAINDTYGHQVGDLVLQRTAHRLQSQLRRIDTVCRVGGEEFALILPDTSEDAGQEVVSRLLAEDPIEEFVHLGQTLRFPVTFSYGMVTFPEVDGDAFELYNKADEVCYFSKDGGRNQCHSWKPDGQHVQLLPPDSTA